MKTRKCIMKHGSLDKYLLNTKPTYLDSKFGLYLKNIIMQKQANPDAEIAYIPGTANTGKSRRTKVWEFK